MVSKLRRGFIGLLQAENSCEVVSDLLLAG